MTPAEQAALDAADRWFAAGLIAMGVCVLLTVCAVALLVREARS